MHTYTSIYAYIGLFMYLLGEAYYINTHLLHCRALETHTGLSKNAPTYSHSYQTRIYIALTTPSKKSTHIHSYQLLIALVAH